MICPSSSEEESEVENVDEEVLSYTGTGSFPKSHARSSSKASSFASIAVSTGIKIWAYGVKVFRCLFFTIDFKHIL